MLRKLMQQVIRGGTARPEDTGTHEEHLHLSTCALLVEMAMIDNEFDEAERGQIMETLRRCFNLSATDARELLEMAEEARDRSSDIWKFTNTLNEACTKEEKVQVIEEIWRVVYADGRLDGHEDYLAHKMGRLLNLPHAEVIEAKLKARGEHP